VMISGRHDRHHLAFTRRSRPRSSIYSTSERFSTAITRTRRCASRISWLACSAWTYGGEAGKIPTRSLLPQAKAGGHSHEAGYCPQLIPAAKHIPHGKHDRGGRRGRSHVWRGGLLISGHTEFIARLITLDGFAAAGRPGRPNDNPNSRPWCWWRWRVSHDGDGTATIARYKRIVVVVLNNPVTGTNATCRTGRTMTSGPALQRLPEILALARLWSKRGRIGRCAGKGARLTDSFCLIEVRGHRWTDPGSTAWASRLSRRL